MAAIRYACPIVTTTPPVAIPAFVDGVNMRLVEPGNSRALADTLRQFYQSPEVRQRLREGAAQLSCNFDWSQIASDYTNFLYWVIESRT
jgi:glycosyltransferase involved in cell wall biosynthesis